MLHIVARIKLHMIYCCCRSLIRYYKFILFVCQERENLHHLTQRQDFLFRSDDIVHILHVADIAKHIRQVRTG